MTARSIVSIDTSSLVTRNTSPPDLLSSESVTTKRSLQSYHWGTLNAENSKLSSLSYIPSTFVGLPLACLLIEEASTRRDFEKHGLCYEEWVSVLHLSTRWGFASLRKLALASINPPTPHDQLLLARRYSIEDWVLPALSSLCERTAPLSLDEARQMKIEDVVTVATVRENIRHCTLRVDVAEIPRRIEATLAGKLSSYEGVDVPPAKPEPPPMGGDAAPSTRTGTPCFGGIGIPSTKPATPMSSGFPIPSTTTVTPCFAGVSTPPTVPETPGFVFSPRPMTPSFVVVTKPSDVVTPPSRPVTPKLDNVDRKSVV